MRKAVHTVLIVLLAAIIFVGQRWYEYVNNKSTAYDEVGMQINSWLPSPLRKWGCDKLHVNFPKAEPPTGCEAEDGKTWM